MTAALIVVDIQNDFLPGGALAVLPERPVQTLPQGLKPCERTPSFAKGRIKTATVIRDFLRLTEKRRRGWRGTLKAAG